MVSEDAAHNGDGDGDEDENGVDAQEVMLVTESVGESVIVSRLD